MADLLAYRQEKLNELKIMAKQEADAATVQVVERRQGQTAASMAQQAGQAAARRAAAPGAMTPAGAKLQHGVRPGSQKKRETPTHTYDLKRYTEPDSI